MQITSSPVVFASTNAGKLQEIQQYLAQFPLNLVLQNHFGVSEIPETGSTFLENALIKARHAAQVTGLPVIADDSGLEVDALQGAPGIYSARYARVGATAAENNAKLLQAMRDVPLEQRTARFQCALVYLHSVHDEPIIACATWEGLILTAPRGSEGFGYDPVFFDVQHQCSAAEMPLVIKNKTSHRAKALHQLLEQLKNSLYYVGS